MRTRFAWLSLLILPGCSVSKEMEIGSTGPETKEVQIRVTLKDRKLAAYQLVIRYDPVIARIARISRGTADAFPASPEFDPGSLESGATRIAAVTTRGSGPGTLHLLTVSFQAVSPGTSKVKLEIEGLYDEVPKPVVADVEWEPKEITFAK